jgi:transposase
VLLGFRLLKVRNLRKERCDVRPRSVWKMLLGVERAVVEDVWVELEAIVVSVRPKSREKQRCGVCGRRCPREDSGEGRRRWRALDLGTTLAYLEADAPRVYCKRHRVVVAAVPWARHDSRFTVAFEDQCCWLAVNTSLISQQLREIEDSSHRRCCARDGGLLALQRRPCGGGR